MRIINLDFFEEKSSTFLSYEKDRSSIIINFNIDEKFINKDYDYRIFFFSSDENNKYNSQKINSKIVENKKNICCKLSNVTLLNMAKKGYLQLRIIMKDKKIENQDEQKIGIIHSFKYPYIIEDNSYFNLKIIV